MERGRKINSIVPDLRISLPSKGNMVPSLHDIKIISSCSTRYKRTRGDQSRGYSGKPTPPNLCCKGEDNRSNLLRNSRWRNAAGGEKASVDGGGERACCGSFWRGLRRHPRPDLPPCPIQGSGCQATAGKTRPTAI